MIIERKGSLPNRHTFLVKPIKAFIDQYFDHRLWIDPFCGYHSPVSNCFYKNDMNPEIPHCCHMEAADFLRTFESHTIGGVILDPPYSLRQLKECYNSVGIDTVPWEMTKGFPSGTHGREVYRVLNLGGIVLKFGWNSSALIGKKFEVIHVLIINHGGNHHDTICTAQVKIK